MRNEKEMYELLLSVAEKDERIHAVYMNGSRTNKNVPRDIFQDYDIVYVVDETRGFIEDKNWIKNFGEILYMQYPDESPYYPSDKEKSYGWLMQFDDGNRIDLHVETIESARENILSDKLCKILLDKDNILPQIPEATDEDYYVKKPTEEEYIATCNEFWWCSNNIAKGLWRQEIPYVQDMANLIVRKELEKMLSWKVGIITDFSVSVGKSAKYMYKWLDKSDWESYLATYFGGNIEEAWDSVMRMCDLFKETAIFVGKELGYEYNSLEGRNARAFLEHVRQLPKDAIEINLF
ncbi:aminoglycoside 6-adenylyltransferase [Clostridium disporicum]|uniref:Adenylyltransferase n=1 Tax=Clostridium disporicum TaxID=84024 RepID=A0A174CPM9_9CLOT|nr:aminoglycoside 6-adenylyltransferase [Clostridium disporicum]CUO14957.1 adenylyltransferase [Clostridium disporicum]